METENNPRFHRKNAEVKFGDDKWTIDYITDRLNVLQIIQETCESRSVPLSPIHKIERALLLQAIIDWEEE
jgi:hypothetical protein